MARRTLRSFARQLFNAVSVLSLIVCLVTAMLWVRSYWWHDEITLRTSDVRMFDLTAGGGLMRVRSVSTVRLEGFGVWHYGAVAATPSAWPTFYFADYGPGDWTLIGPMWLLCALATLAPIGRVLYLRRRKQRLPGHCDSCGYDLRATPERCPECGSTVIG